MNGLTRIQRQKRYIRRSSLTISLLGVVLFLLSVVLLFAPPVSSGSSSNSSSKQEDLYSILGVPKTASIKEIKKAYRRKTLETHPDKRPADVTEEEAAQAFHKVVSAYEVLTDEDSRRHYDRTGGVRDPNNARQGGSGGGGFQWSGGGSFHFNFNFRSGSGSYHGGRRRAPQKLKDRFDVKEAQSRVLHVVSLEQLKTIMLDDDDLLERNLLLCFVNPEQETVANDEVVFPWPFAAMSSQGIWWGDLLQPVMVRFHKSNEITELFGIPNGQDLTAPIFVFGRRGSSMESNDVKNWARIETKSHEEFSTWMWKRISVKLVFINKHTHAVEGYWIEGTAAKVKMVLEPGESKVHHSYLTHEWWFRDNRTDRRPDSPGRYKLSQNCNLASWKITSDEKGQELVIEPKVCFDLSGHCGFWNSRRECEKNPRFMGEVCRKTCELCTEADDEKLQNVTTKTDGASDEL